MPAPSAADNYAGVFEGRLKPGTRPALLIVDVVAAYLTEGSPLFMETAAAARDSNARLAKAARSFLADHDPGVFIVMTSNHAFRTIPGCFPYNVAKTALTGLVRALAIEWCPAIRVVGVAPGFIETPGNQKWFDSFPDPQAERTLTEKRHPVGRIGTPEEVGNLCAFLASPLAGFISGDTVLIDGGRSALMQDPP